MRDGNGDSETLGVTDGLAETDAEPVSLYEGVFKAELLANGERDGISDDVYVVVTVSVTPVGNVVILGVGVPTFDNVTDRETLVVAHRDTGGDRVDETDFVLPPEVVSVFDIRGVRVCLALDETVVEDDCDLLVLAEGVYVTEALVVLELLLLLVRVAEATELLDDLGLNVDDGVAVSAGEPVGLRVSLGLGPIVTDSDDKGDAVLLPATDALTVRVSCPVNEPLPLLE